MTTRRYARPIASLGQIVITWIWIDFASGLVALVGAAIDLNLLRQMADPAIVDPWNDIPHFAQLSAISPITGWFPLATLLVTGPIILRWIYRADINAHAFARGLDISPGWAVGWYFIPFAALWKPFQGMSEIWRASHRPANWRTLPLPAQMRWWWGTWLVASIVGNAAGRMGMFGEPTVSLMTTTTMLAILSLSVGALTNIALVWVITRVTRAQGERMAEGLGCRQDPESAASESHPADPPPV